MDKDNGQVHKPTVSQQVNKLAEEMIALIAKGNLNYREEWDVASCPMPMNYVTKHKYTGSNLTLLALSSWGNGWNDMRFVTRKQLGHLQDTDGNKAQLMEDAVPSTIIRPFVVTKRIEVGEDEDLSDVDPEDLEEGEDGKLYKLVDRVFFKHSNVYNVSETTASIEPYAAIPPRVWQDSEFFERLLSVSQIPLRHGGDTACYRRDSDTIQMPSKDAFRTSGSYYGALMHEFFHATGAPHRFAREKGKKFGDEKYALEELRAELFGIACTTMFGLDKSKENSAAYLESWSQAVRDGKGKAILKAAADVEKVLLTVMQIANGEQPTKAPWFPEVDFSIMPTPFKDAELRQAEKEAENFEKSREVAREMESAEALAKRIFPRAFGYDADRELTTVGEMLFTMPPLGATDRDEEDAVVYLHMTGEAGEEYYLTEFDPSTGNAFGWVMDDGDVFNGKSRYIEAEELADVHRIHLRFEPTEISVVIRDLEEEAYERLDNSGDREDFNYIAEMDDDPYDIEERSYSPGY